MRRRVAPAAGFAIAVSLVCSLIGCTTASNEGAADAASPASACVAAGGLCGVSACSTLGPQSCGVAGETCCLDSLGAACAAEAGSAPIVASSYDQSCQTDSDCVGIGVGDPCYPCGVVCPGAAAINASSLAQYMADVLRSPAGKGDFVCNCPLYSPSSVCCNAGTCAPSCLDLVDAGTDAAPGADAGKDAAPEGDASIDAAAIVDAGTDAPAASDARADAEAMVDAGSDAAAALDAALGDAGDGGGD
jgi:hypothetical protein